MFFLRFIMSAVIFSNLIRRFKQQFKAISHEGSFIFKSPCKIIEMTIEFYFAN